MVCEDDECCVEYDAEDACKGDEELFDIVSVELCFCDVFCCHLGCYMRNCYLIVWVWVKA